VSDTCQFVVSPLKIRNIFSAWSKPICRQVRGQTGSIGCDPFWGQSAMSKYCKRCTISDNPEFQALLSSVSVNFPVLLLPWPWGPSSAVNCNRTQSYKTKAIEQKLQSKSLNPDAIVEVFPDFSEASHRVIVIRMSLAA